MTRYQADVALLTDHRYTAARAPEGDWYLANILHDDRLLQEALLKRKITSVRVDWADPEIDWSAFRCAVFRTTWDYYERVPEFSSWLKRAAGQTRLCNDPLLIRWNLDKHYLADLADKGVPVVPTRYIETGQEVDLAEILIENDWHEAVVKPCISGGARHTYRFNRDSARQIRSVVEPLIRHEALMVQPFLDEIIQTGEDTLMVLDGVFTHAVRKKAKPGDFRVQDDHGGTVHPCRPEPEQIELAEQAMAACSPEPAYGRVDMIRDTEGRWSIMELELIEPELWLRYHPPAADPFARAIARLI